MSDYERDSEVIARQEKSPQHHPWYAIHVQSKFERAASRILHDKGYEEFLPLYRAKRQWSDRVKEVDLPLFPGYFFCRIDITERLLPIVTTPGVVRIVSAGNTPVPVSDCEIESYSGCTTFGPSRNAVAKPESGLPDMDRTWSPGWCGRHGTRYQ